MKITDVSTQLFEYRTRRRRGDAHNPSGRTRQNGVLVEVHTDEGITGVAMGLPSCEPHVPMLKSLLVGQDPRRVRGLWQKMADRLFKPGNVGAMNDALSALDIALWDLKAKAYGEPLWRLLGAAEPRVKAYASGGDMPLSDEQLRDFYVHMAGLGFKAGKLKVGLDIDDDLRRIGIMQDALGGAGQRPALMVDGSEYWFGKQAVRRVVEMERHFDLTWVEEPVSRFDYLGLRTVRQHIRSPLAAGENLDNITQFTPLVAHECVDILQINWWTSGITGALQIAELAYGHGLPVTVGYSPGKLMAHVAAALPNHMMIEVHDDQTEEPIFDADNWIEDGFVVLGERAGNGLKVLPDQLERHATAALTPGSGIGNKGRRAGAARFEVPATAEEKRVGASGPEAI
ncbi:MAG: mandelate racemase/muconate lactonizing enzyme family protein [Trueperaceae bacterium]|nr:mandelate racemase/muconate lactonizing enzyme family protein [Trueperaceae bacterium]